MGFQSYSLITLVIYGGISALFNNYSNEVIEMEFIDVFISHFLKNKKNTKKAQRSTVYGRYLYYCDLVGKKPVSNYRFYKELEKRGIKKTADGKYFLNVELIK